MKNKWKIAFWIQALIFFFLVLFLLYNIIDQAVSITYMREGYKDTESDLMQISKAIEGKLYKSDMDSLINRNPYYDGGDLELNRIIITFTKEGLVDSITTKW